MQDWFETSLEIAASAGLDSSQLILDPGFGFGKTLAQNYALLGNLKAKIPKNPIMVGTSRKSMIGKILGNEPSERLAGTIATTVIGYLNGGHIFRVHDVRANRDALRIAQASLYGPETQL